MSIFYVDSASFGDVQITGSVNITGSLFGTASYANQSLSSSLAQTASYVLNAVSSSFVTTSSYSVTSSYAIAANNASAVDVYVFGSNVDSYLLMSNVAGTTGVSVGGDADLRYNASTNKLTVGNISATTLTGSLQGTASWAENTISSSFALTASYVANASSFPFTGSAIISGSLTVTGSSNLPSITGSLLGTASYANQALSSSFATTASYALNAAAASSFPYTGSAIISGSLSVIGPTTMTGSLAVSSSATGSIFSVSASYIDFDFDSFLFSGSTTFQGSLIATNTTASFGNANITGSLFGTSSWSVSSSRATTSSFALTASFALNAAAGSGFPFTGSAVITGSLTVIGRNTLTGSFTASNGESVDYLNQNLFQPATTGSKVYQSTIAPIFRTTAPNQTSTALRVNPTFSGSFSGSNTQNLIVDFGAVNVGSQFTVNDITSGSIYMVNDISGLPIIEATSDWSVNIYDYPTTIFRKTGSAIILSSSFTVVTGSGIEFQVTNTGVKIGNAATDTHTITGSLNISGSITVNTGSITVTTGSITITTGSITMPNRPAFRVVGVSSTDINATTVLSGSATSVDYNQGNYYNNATGVFTAPIAGLYQVFLNARVGSDNSQMQAIVYKNSNIAQLMWEAPGLAASTHFGVSGIVKLAVNDTLNVTVTVGKIQFDGNDSWGVTYIG